MIAASDPRPPEATGLELVSTPELSRRARIYQRARDSGLEECVGLPALPAPRANPAWDDIDDEPPPTPRLPRPVIVTPSPDATALLNEAYRHADLGNLDKAFEVAERATKIAPLRAACHFALAIIHQERKELGKAEHAFRRTLYLAPESAHAHWRLGLLLAAKGDAHGARRALLNAMEMARRTPDDPLLRALPASIAPHLIKIWKLHD